MNKGRKIAYVILLFIIFMIGSVPVLFKLIIVDEVRFQMLETRLPAKMPIWSWEKSSIDKYFTELDQYLDDHFPFRKVLMSSYSTLLYNFGVASKPDNMLFGDDGFLFAGNSLNLVIDQVTGKNIFKANELAEWNNCFYQKKEYLEKLDIKQYVAIAPNKHSIYPENMPSYIIPSKINRLQQVEDSHPPFPFLNLKTALLEKKSDWEEFSLFKKTDTHWTTVGAYLAYQEIIKNIQIDFEDIKPIELQQANFKTIPELVMGDLKSHLQILFPREGFKVEILKNEEWNDDLIKTDIDGNVLDFNSLDKIKFQEKAIVYNAEKPYTVLFFEDSFSFVLAPFLNQTFGKVIYIHYSDPSSIELTKLVEEYQPDIVLYQMCERQLYQKQILHNNISSKLEEYHYTSYFKMDADYLLQNSQPNQHLTNLYADTNGLSFQVIDNDPIIILPEVELIKDESVLVKIDISIPENTITELFYTTQDNTVHNRDQLLSQHTSKGRNTILFYINEIDINGELLRFDPGLAQGQYTIHSVEILNKDDQLESLNTNSN